MYDMLSAQGRRDGVGTPPGTGCWNAADFSADFCVTFQLLFKTPKCRRKISENLRKHLPIICALRNKNLRTIICAETRAKNLRKNQRKNRTKNLCENSTSLEDER